MARRQQGGVDRVTDSAIRIVRSLSSWQKTLLTVASILAVLWGAVRFAVDVEFRRHEKEMKKIGRPEFSRFRDETRQELKDFDRRIDQLEKAR